MKPSPDPRSLQLRGGLDNERVRKLIGGLATPLKHPRKHGNALTGVGARRVSANEGVPGEEIRLRNLVEHLASIVKAREARQRARSDELAGREGVGG